MQITKNHPGRNEFLECLRMLAMFLVVCFHVPFPGKAGRFLVLIGRFAVPMFFAISGYFSFGIRSDKIAKRFWHLVKLNGIAILISLLCTAIETVYSGGSVWERWISIIPSFRTIGRWLFIHFNPFNEALWYLTAIVFCYGVLWVYTAFFGKERIHYRPLYIVGTALLAIEFAVADWVRLYVDGIPYYCFRNGWFIGLPMFCIGLFLREYQQQITENYHLNVQKLLLIWLAGLALMLVQWLSYGPSELPLGAVLQCAALILLAQYFPVLSHRSPLLKRIISTFGFLSLSIYMVHMGIFGIYNRILASQIKALVGSLIEPWLLPLFIYFVSLVISIIAWFIMQRIVIPMKTNRLKHSS